MPADSPETPVLSARKDDATPSTKGRKPKTETKPATPQIQVPQLAAPSPLGLTDASTVGTNAQLAFLQAQLMAMHMQLAGLVKGGPLPSPFDPTAAFFPAGMPLAQSAAVPAAAQPAVQPPPTSNKPKAKPRQRPHSGGRGKRNSDSGSASSDESAEEDFYEPTISYETKRQLSLEINQVFHVLVERCRFSEMYARHLSL